MPKLIEPLLKRMGHFEFGFPQKELELALQAPNKDLLISSLLEVLHTALAEARQDVSPPNKNHVFALYLLAKFKQAQALPILVEFLSLPGETPFEWWEDVIHEDMGKIFASLCDADPQTLKNLIENPSLEIHIRYSALEALNFTLGLNRLSRQDLVEYFRFLLTEKKFSDKPLFLARVISCACGIYPEELLETIASAFHSRRVDESVITLESVNFYLKKDRSVVLKFLQMKKSQLTENLQKEMAWLYQTRTPAGRKPSTPATRTPNTSDSGRNDPCPCGSGKKFKKCCLK